MHTDLNSLQTKLRGNIYFVGVTLRYQLCEIDIITQCVIFYNLSHAPNSSAADVEFVYKMKSMRQKLFLLNDTFGYVLVPLYVYVCIEALWGHMLPIRISVAHAFSILILAQ
jgi:hypothetical protein